MSKVRIQHRTVYRYTAPVNLGTHTLLLRPRESRELRLLSNEITVVPEAKLSWSQDVSGNAIATATFRGKADTLIIDAVSEILLDSTEWPIFPIAASAANYPFRYSDDEWTDLGALAIQQYGDQDGSMERWVRGFTETCRTDTLTLLRYISEGIHGRSRYEPREVEGTQTPVQTLERCRGTCRDFAVLFVEAVRSLGFGARIVSGYLDMRGEDMTGSKEAGSTHAWAEVYLPGAGWVTFDPTNRSIGGFNLIPVAVARDIRQTIPVSGTFAGPKGTTASMEVEVAVTES